MCAQYVSYNQYIQDIVKGARISFGMDIRDALLPIMITDPSPALRKGHYDFYAYSNNDS